jgi:hypothetical protein
MEKEGMFGRNWGRTKVENRQLRRELKNKAAFRPKNALFAIEKMNLRKRQVGATPVVAFFLNRHFWGQKHHFKPKYRVYFWHLSLITKRSPWSTSIPARFLSLTLNQDFDTLRLQKPEFRHSN